MSFARAKLALSVPDHPFGWLFFYYSVVLIVLFSSLSAVSSHVSNRFQTANSYLETSDLDPLASRPSVFVLFFSVLARHYGVLARGLPVVLINKC